MRYPSLCGFVASLFAGALAAHAATGDSLYARPGASFDAGSTHLNFYCLGSGSPAVVFDAGYGDWSPAWAIVHPQVAKWTRACAYDRAGSGFSGPGVRPRTSARIADELLAALRQGGIRGPYILVGSAYGGLNVRTFAQRHPEETAGLVLVDADATEMEPPALRESDYRDQREIVAALTTCRDKLAAGKPLELPRPGKAALRCDRDYFFRGLPEAAWSEPLNEKVAELTRTKLDMYEAMISEMAQVRGGEAWLAKHEKPLGSRPIRVLTSGQHGGGPRDAASPEGQEYQRQVAAAQARWLALSSDSKQVFARKSSEYIQLDEPSTVLDAIREVFDAARRRPGAR
ncbi:MAG TPA: alpha/beta hydrolase [Usitatibacter sp.]|nr:alpha/beta hydrolase [Usitatibacter sp.]